MRSGCSHRTLCTVSLRRWSDDTHGDAHQLHRSRSVVLCPWHVRGWFKHRPNYHRRCCAVFLINQVEVSEMGNRERSFHYFIVPAVSKPYYVITNSARSSWTNKTQWLRRSTNRHVFSSVQLWRLTTSFTILMDDCSISRVHQEEVGYWRMRCGSYARLRHHSFHRALFPRELWCYEEYIQCIRTSWVHQMRRWMCWSTWSILYLQNNENIDRKTDIDRYHHGHGFQWCYIFVGQHKMTSVDGEQCPDTQILLT